MSLRPALPAGGGGGGGDGGGEGGGSVGLIAPKIAVSAADTVRRPAVATVSGGQFGGHA